MSEHVKDYRDSLLPDYKFKGRKVCVLTNYRTGSTFFIRETFLTNRINQFRIKNKSQRDVFALVKTAVEISQKYSFSKLIINDYWEFAMECGAFGGRKSNGEMNRRHRRAPAHKKDALRGQGVENRRRPTLVSRAPSGVGGAQCPTGAAARAPACCLSRLRRRLRRSHSPPVPRSRARRCCASGSRS